MSSAQEPGPESWAKLIVVILSHEAVLWFVTQQKRSHTTSSKPEEMCVNGIQVFKDRELPSDFQTLHKLG